MWGKYFKEMITSHLYVRTEKGGNKPSVNGKIISSGNSKTTKMSI
ncbi:hypothetical protein [Anaerostipes sp.]